MFKGQRVSGFVQKPYTSAVLRAWRSQRWPPFWAAVRER